ncbi:acetyl-coenzyme A synthetase [Trichonephila inaurata madagascariensis]|uniref:Acetyl-coenzyme A synthetase n=1 Tax=Trichonephila inaurata madagascariensis TaxID=2747483 RepID=A0A8X6X5F3_9ARAC|nr:acetyl-coenzyme A synthetase [Trichonephila inaurata madagascariensis]
MAMSHVGWVSWNMVCTLCFGGIALLLYEGFPYYLSPTYFWDLVQKHKLTNIFLPSKVLEELGKRGYFPTKEHDLSSVKTCIATGSVVKPLSYDFFYNKIKKDALFGAPYGCTEINAMCLMVDPTVSIHKGESSVPALGIDVQCLDETGKHVEGEYGELVIAKPSPILLLGLWGDSDGSLMRKMYYSKFQGKFAIGDFVIVNPVTKGYIICGRSDDTVKQRGTRFGSSEIYNYNMNGKKMESIVKNIINKRPYNSDSVVNPECLSSFCDIPELKDF